MTLEIKYLNNRTKVFRAGEYLKQIPSKYAGVIQPKHILNEKRKRLTNEERFLIEYEYVLQALKIENKNLYNFLKRKSPKGVRIVTTTTTTYYNMIFKGGADIQISKTLYDICPNKLQNINRNY